MQTILAPSDVFVVYEFESFYLFHVICSETTIAMYLQFHLYIVKEMFFHSVDLY